MIDHNEVADTFNLSLHNADVRVVMLQLSENAQRTIVVSPAIQGNLTADNHGRDHHGRCFTMWMAGAGIKRGFEFGRTDDYSYNIVENPVHIRDMNATILNQLGIDHNQLTFKYQGLDQKLVGTEPAQVVQDILA